MPYLPFLKLDSCWMNMLSNLIAFASTKYRGLSEDKKLINLSCRLLRMTSQKTPFPLGFTQITPCAQFGQLLPN